MLEPQLRVTVCLVAATLQESNDPLPAERTAVPPSNP
jgi:hypothetical protein